MSEQPAVQQEKRAKRTGSNLGWIWLIVAFIGIGILFFYFSNLTEQMTGINQSIQENTQALLDQDHILADIQHGIQQLILEIKDSVDKIIQSS